MKAFLGVLLLLACSVLVGAGTAVANVGTMVTYRVTLQDPGFRRQAEISYTTSNGTKVFKQAVLEAFVPWERTVPVPSPGEVTLGIFADPGGHYLGEILRGGAVVASSEIYLDPSWERVDEPYGVGTNLAHVNLP